MMLPIVHAVPNNSSFQRHKASPHVNALIATTLRPTLAIFEACINNL
jgi:hypothetical protein